MVNLCIDILEDLIKKGEIKKDDPIIEEVKERLIFNIQKYFPDRINEIPSIDKLFKERFE